MRLAAILAAILAAAFVLGGCAALTVSAANTADWQCRSDAATFAGYERCVRGAVATNSLLNEGPHTDLVTRYLAGLSLIKSRVDSGEIKNETGLFVAAEYYSELKDTFYMRTAERAKVWQRLGQSITDLSRKARGELPYPPIRLQTTCTKNGVFLNCW